MNTSEIADASEIREKHNSVFLLSFGKGMLCGLLLLTISFCLLNYFQIVQLSSLSPAFTFLPQLSNRSTASHQALLKKNVFPTLDPVQQCHLAKKYQGLIDEIKTFPNGVEGRFLGKIQHITLDSHSNPAFITLIATTSGSMQTFDIRHIRDTVYALPYARPLASTFMKPGKVAVLNFTCLEKDTYAFKLTEIGIFVK